MAVRDMSELDPAARREVEAYLSELDGGLCAVSREIAGEALEDVSMYLMDRLDASSSAEDARRAIDELGRPDEYAARLCAELHAVGPGSGSEHSDSGQAVPRGRVLGMPYDARMPTGDNIQSRMWNPSDPRIFPPKLFGVGWTVNFAALAVKARLIRPDDEDEPFASTPEPALWTALFVPLVLCATVVAATALAWNSLPSQVAIHWDIHGEVDGYASPAVALLPMVAFAVLPTAYALWTFVVGRSKATRAVTIAFATMFTVLAASIVAAMLADSRGEPFGAAWPWVMIVACMAVPFALLLVLSRLGYAREVRRDLGA